MAINAEQPENPSSGASPRSYVGIHFECCNVYVRVYRRPDQTEYVGRCPRCARSVRLKVGPGGTDARIFRAT
ncbi:MAG: hypothetical protein U1D55_14740 [Phycisphaerae bacterium]